MQTKSCPVADFSVVSVSKNTKLPTDSVFIFAFFYCVGVHLNGHFLVFFQTLTSEKSATGICDGNSEIFQPHTREKTSRRNKEEEDAPKLRRGVCLLQRGNVPLVSRALIFHIPMDMSIECVGLLARLPPPLPLIKKYP